MRNASFKSMLYVYVDSLCCVGFASLHVVCDEPGMSVCSSFLVSVCMNPFAMVLFNVCSAVTVCLECLLLGKKEGSSHMSLQLLRGGIWACMRFHCLCLCWVL